MSWHDKRIYSNSEIRQGTEKLPSNFHVGEDVTVSIFGENEELIFDLPCVVLGVSITGNHQITYDLGFETTSGFYIRANGFRGFINKAGETSEIDGGLSPLPKEFKKSARSNMKLVSPHSPCQDLNTNEKD